MFKEKPSFVCVCVYMVALMRIWTDNIRSHLTIWFGCSYVPTETSLSSLAPFRHPLDLIFIQFKFVGRFCIVLSRDWGSGKANNTNNTEHGANYDNKRFLVKTSETCIRCCGMCIKRNKVYNWFGFEWKCLLFSRISSPQFPRSNPLIFTQTHIPF